MVYQCPPFNLITDFPNGLDVGLLTVEIQNSGSYPEFLFISVVNDNVIVVFTSLPAAGKPPLNVIVANHNPSTSAIDPNDLASVQIRRTSTAGPEASFADVTCDTNDFENFPARLERDTVNRERIVIRESGTYRLSYHGTVTTGTVQCRIVKNGANAIGGSFAEVIPGSDESIIAAVVMIDIADGDYVNLQMNSPGGTGVIKPGLVFTAQRSKASEGNPGPQGPQGAAGAGTGDVLGAVSSTDNAIVRFDGTSGTALQNSGVIINDTDDMLGVKNLDVTTIDVQNLSTGQDGHVRLRTGDDYGTDTYNHGLDASATNRIIGSIEEGTYRVANAVVSRGHNATAVVSGVSVSNDGGSTWVPVLAATQDQKLGIGTNTPSESLDVVGNIAVSGTVDGRDVAADGSTQDSHIADASIHRTINDAGTATTDLWSADKITTELTTKANSSHTHTHDDITDFDAEVNTLADARITVQKGAANGLATLDGTGKVPASQLALSSATYVGTWNANTNTPTLTSGTGTQGDYYVVSVAGTTTIDTINDWGVGDWIIFNGTVWEKADHSDAVTSVAGKQGAIVLDTADITSGTFADARIAASNVTQHVGSIIHQSLSGAGTNTHTQIDSHIANTSNPHSVTKSQVGLGNVLDIKHKIDATTTPLVSNDDTESYSAGSTWIDVTNDKAYICLDNSTGAAVWLDITNQNMGEINTASSVGGTAIFKQKTGVDFEFKGLTASSLINLTANTNNVEIDVNQGNITTVGTLNAGSITSGFGSIDIGSSPFTTTGSMTCGNLLIDQLSFNDSSITYNGSSTLNKLLFPVNQANGLRINDGTDDYIHFISTIGGKKIKFHKDLEITGNITISGTVDGIDVSNHTHSASDIVSGSFDNARVSAANVTQHTGSIVHQNLSGAGTYTHTQIDAHINNTSNPHSVTKAQVGLGDVLNIKHKVDGIVAPTSSNDNTEGYSVGSKWVDTITGNAYICTNASTGAAVWSLLTPQTLLYGSEHHEVSDDTVTCDTSDNWVTKLTMTTSSLPTGKYRVGWSYQCNANTTSKNMEIRVRVNDTSDLSNHVFRPSDANGSFDATGTEQQYQHAGFDYLNGISGVQTIDIEFRRESGNPSFKCSMWNTRLELWRVS